jgi:AcrR family transcriptional regulator
MPVGQAPEHTGARAGRRRDPSVDARAIEAVLGLYNDHGLAGTSFEQVAKRASVGKAALYSRWSSVEELLIDGLRTIAPPPAVLDSGDLRHDLHALVLLLCDLYSGQYGRVTVRILLDASHAPQLRPYYDDFVSTYVHAAREIVLRGVARRELSPAIDSAPLLEELFGATMLHVLFFERPDKQLTSAAASRFADKLIDSILDGARM